jgi:hypothetical protein
MAGWGYTGAVEQFAASDKQVQLDAARQKAQIAEAIARTGGEDANTRQWRSNATPSSSGFSGAGAGGGGSSVSMSGATGGAPAGTGVTDTRQTTYDPWSKYRAQAGDKLAAGMGSDPSNFYREKLQSMSEGNFSPDDPSYQWRLKQGQQAVERSLAAKGLLNSGNAAIELQQYGQGAASQEYGAQFDRMLKGLSGVSQQYDTQQQRLMQMAGIGLDPTAGAKLGIAQQEANTNSQQVANQFSLGMTNAANTIRAAEIGAAAGNANAANLGMLQSYQMAQNSAGQDAIESELFFNREGGLGSGSNFMEMWSTGRATNPGGY